MKVPRINKDNFISYYPFTPVYKILVFTKLYIYYAKISVIGYMSLIWNTALTFA